MSNPTLITGDELTKIPGGINRALRERAATIRWRLNSLIPEFQGPAYDYILTSDELATYPELPDVEDETVCKVKLFLPAGRSTYYVAAVTEYGDTPVMTGFLVSPLGPDCDGFGDESLEEFAAARAMGLPPERDLYFDPTPLREIRSAVVAGRAP